MGCWPRWVLGTVLAVICALGLLGWNTQVVERPDEPATGLCTVYVERDDVPGCAIPGDEDTVIFDLPVGRTLTVVGQAVLADGALWWLVEVPNIDRVWVLPEAVRAAGDCDHLPAIDPPLSLLTSPCCSSLPGPVTPRDEPGPPVTGGASGGCDE